MIIEGRELRDQLDSFPLGTQFMCVGHWDVNPYYYEGVIYTLTEMDDDGDKYPILECKETKDFGFRNARGNGYSGTWQRIVPFEGKELEDYL